MHYNLNLNLNLKQFDISITKKICNKILSYVKNLQTGRMDKRKNYSFKPDLEFTYNGLVAPGTNATAVVNKLLVVYGSTGNRV